MIRNRLSRAEAGVKQTVEAVEDTRTLEKLAAQFGRLIDNYRTHGRTFARETSSPASLLAEYVSRLEARELIPEELDHLVSVWTEENPEQARTAYLCALGARERGGQNEHGKEDHGD